MKKSKNICKFVTVKTNENLTTSNFIFESEAPKASPLQIYDTNAMYLVTSGSGYLSSGLLREPLKTGSMFFTFSGTPFSIENTDNMHYLYISFSGGRSGELFDRFGITPFKCVFDGYEELIPVWQNSIARANSDNLDLMSEGMLLYGFSLIGDNKEAKNGVERQVLKMLEENFTDPGISLDTIADELGYSSKYLSKLFKNRLSVRFSEYLRTLRLKHAVFLLEQGVTSIKNVALLSGFSDPLYFSKVFKSSMGVSPSEYVLREHKREDSDTSRPE